MQSKRRDAIHLCVGRVCASTDYYSHDPNFHLNIMYLTFPTSHLYSLAIKLITNIEIKSKYMYMYIYTYRYSFSITFFNSLKTLKIFSSFSLSNISTWKSNSNSSHQFLSFRFSAFKLTNCQENNNKKTRIHFGGFIEAIRSLNYILTQWYSFPTLFFQQEYYLLH